MDEIAWLEHGWDNSWNQDDDPQQVKRAVDLVKTLTERAKYRAGVPGGKPRSGFPDRVDEAQWREFDRHVWWELSYYAYVFGGLLMLGQRSRPGDKVPYSWW